MSAVETHELSVTEADAERLSVSLLEGTAELGVKDPDSETADEIAELEKDAEMLEDIVCSACTTGCSEGCRS